MLIVIEVVRIQRNCGAALVDWGGGEERRRRRRRRRRV